MMDMIQNARDLGAKLQETSEYKMFAEAKAAFEGDSGLQEQIQKLNLIRMQLQNLMQKESQEQSEMDAKNQEMREVYGEIAQNLTMQNYQKTSTELNGILQQIQAIITAAANGDDPQTFDPQEACTGDCTSCGGQCH